MSISKSGLALAATLLLTLLPGSSHALNQLVLSPEAQVSDLNDQVVVDLAILFDDSTVGGAVRIGFDPTRLLLVDVVFDDTLGDDRVLRCPTTGDPGSIPCPADSSFVAFGAFGLLSGSLNVAALIFETLLPGAAEVSAVVQSPFGGPIGELLEVDADTALIEVVPEPGTFALLGLGLAGLAFRGRR